MTIDKRGPRPAEVRLSRLLVMLPWIMERGEVSLAETAKRFGLSEDEVVKALETAAMCGLPPFRDEMIDVFIDEGMITAGIPRLFDRPLRLTSVEAFELLASGQAAMALPGADPSGPLGRGLAKVAALLGDDVAAGMRVEFANPPLLDAITAAALVSERLTISYRSPHRDEAVSRSVVPRQVFADRGQWYMVASDASGKVVTFRIDRVESVEVTGEFDSEFGDVLPPPGLWFNDADVPRATLRLAPAARWVIERYPIDSASAPDDDGWVLVTLPVATELWLQRVMVRLGPDAELLEPAVWRDIAAVTAASVLERYLRS